MEKLLSYFNGDSMAADSWRGKYQMKDNNGNPLEETPADMHIRLAKEFAKKELAYREKEKRKNLSALSPFGKMYMEATLNLSEDELVQDILHYFNNFKHIVPQGSIMSNLGNIFVFGSLSNCFVIASPEDSYGGICRADEELVQLMKRRGGVGTTLDNLRPVDAAVTNAAKSSTGVPSFAERYSNSTREVAQEGRRGALMLLLSVMHPDIFKFVTMKDDRTKVTGANVSVMFTDEFMYAVEAEADFICRFPVDEPYPSMVEMADIPYNTVVTAAQFCMDVTPKCKYVMKIRAKELFDEFVNMAWDNAEPGAAYLDRIQNYSPDGVYKRFRPTKCNPCGEIWMGDYDACRLMAQNLFSIVKNPFTSQAKIDYDLLYEVSYRQQRLSDDLIDLEVDYIQRIIDKLRTDPEPLYIRQREIDLWIKIQETTRDGRRTGNGITGLGDMLAALDLKYDSLEAIAVIDKVMKTKMQAELDCTIDLAILRGTFEGWAVNKEFQWYGELVGTNDFYKMLTQEFPEQATRMQTFGRRNVSWSTVAPTGTVSLMTQTTSGLEPLFKAYYIRRKKINPNDEGVRVDFIDQNGDRWQEYPVLHPKFKEWIKVNSLKLLAIEGEVHFDLIDKNMIQNIFEQSPWCGSESDNISWEKRIEIQSIIQKYTSNAISSTINLPTNVSKETVYGIYIEAWKKGLKGVTIYRDGSRTGVLVTDNKITTKDNFGYNDSIKRPKELEADYYCVTVKGKKYAVIVGLLNGNPYELFAFEDPLCDNKLNGTIVKVASGVYSFVSPNYTIENLQLTSEHSDEKLLTRWVSLLLRHGANPKFIAQQVEKSEVNITSFAKVVARVLKNYIPDETIKGEACANCGEHTMIYEEGCKKCSSCGYSKC